MHSLISRPAVAAAALTVTAGALAGALALKPAIAANGTMTMQVGPFALVTCSVSGGPCEQYKNLLAGTGVEGDAAKGTGVKGTAANNGTTGVLGTNNKGVGVRGTSALAQGVLGMSTSSTGVEGDSSSGRGVYGSGVEGVVGVDSSGTGFGVEGTSGGGYAVVGTSSSGIGAWGQSTGSGIGLAGSSTSGYGLSTSTGSSSASAISATNSIGNAIDAYGGPNGASYYARPNGGGTAAYLDSTGGSGYGVVAFTYGSPTYWGENNNGVGMDITGSYIGVAARSNSYPFAAYDESSNLVAYIDATGNLYIHGAYGNFARVRGGGAATAYAPASTSPMIEDNGTAQLVDGVATVSLDPTFAQTIDLSRAYRVMLTPDGDTRGLYVASKGTSGFVVREVQGGHSSIAFDYHIYAPALGRANQHMTIVNGMVGPKAPMLHPARIKPSKPPVLPHH
ncbi:MAG TPA: hypothetical protein VFO25_03320 [Candidatus Eremiobacteraceae bacterium]|nr:hypothetical protein [Candidatus Eremiobacteraceae bacterium]